MKNKKDMIKWLNNLKSDIGQPQHSQLWHYTEILDVIARYLESTERPKREWIDKDGWSHCSNCEKYATPHNNGCEIEPCHTLFCPWCGADMKGADDD